jgi:adenine phosphoribosyltransferase
LATGGTANAALKLLKKSGAKVKSFLCLIELSFLNGKQELDIPFKSLIRY